MHNTLFTGDFSIETQISSGFVTLPRLMTPEGSNLYHTTGIAIQLGCGKPHMKFGASLILEVRKNVS